jgi:hypothetical protein
VRPEARPHVTPLVAVWLDDTLFFVTGEDERKANNLTVLGRVADVYASKYDWHYEVHDGTFRETHGPDPSARNVSAARVVVFEVAPTTVFGYGRGETFSATRWRFSDSPPANA